MVVDQQPCCRMGTMKIIEVCLLIIENCL